MTREKPGRRPVRLHPALWALLAIATLGILWGAAEQHDQSCYGKAAVQVASGSRAQSDCLLLPWNDPPAAVKNRIGKP